MSMSIYAGVITEHPEFGPIMGPVIDFKHWDKTVLADDADARQERGEDPFIENPEFIENAGLNLSNYNTRALFELLGFYSEDGMIDAPIDQVHAAAMSALNGPKADYSEPTSASIGNGGCKVVSFGIPEGYMKERLVQLLALITTGRKLGATHICAA